MLVQDICGLCGRERMKHCSADSPDILMYCLSVYGLFAQSSPVIIFGTALFIEEFCLTDAAAPFRAYAACSFNT